MKAKTDKKTKQKRPSVRLKDLKPKKNPKAGLISGDPDDDDVLIP